MQQSERIALITAAVQLTQLVKSNDYEEVLNRFDGFYNYLQAEVEKTAYFPKEQADKITEINEADD